jgi:hypothetical protein
LTIFRRVSTIGGHAPHGGHGATDARSENKVVRMELVLNISTSSKPFAMLSTGLDEYSKQFYNMFFSYEQFDPFKTISYLKK